MTKIIDELWYGNVDPAKNSGQNNNEIKHIERLIQNNGELLRKHLSKDAAERFEKYNDCMDEYISLTNKQAFSDGFCLAMRLAAEALTFADETVG